MVNFFPSGAHQQEAIVDVALLVSLSGNTPLGKIGSDSFKLMEDKPQKQTLDKQSLSALQARSFVGFES